MSEKYTTAERLIRLETMIEHSEREVQNNGLVAKEGLKILAEKLDELDKKWDDKFTELKAMQEEDAKELAKLKERGAGVLTGLGVIFTITATAFSDFFSYVKHSIFG